MNTINYIFHILTDLIKHIKYANHYVTGPPKGRPFLIILPSHLSHQEKIEIIGTHTQALTHTMLLFHID